MRLIALDGRHVVTTVSTDPLGGAHLSMHSFNGDHCPIQVEELEYILQHWKIRLDLLVTRLWVRIVPVARSITDRG